MPERTPRTMLDALGSADGLSPYAGDLGSFVCTYLAELLDYEP